MSKLNDILLHAAGVLNTDRPMGVPQIFLTRETSLRAEDIPGIDLSPGTDEVLPMRERSQEGAPIGTRPLEAVLHGFDLILECSAARPSGEPTSAIALTDPLTSWVKNALVGADWKSVGAMGCSEVRTEFFPGKAGERPMYLARVTMRVYYLAQAGNTSAT